MFRYYWVHIRCKNKETVERWKKILYSMKKYNLTAEDVLSLLLDYFERYHVSGSLV